MYRSKHVFVAPIKKIKLIVTFLAVLLIAFMLQSGSSTRAAGTLFTEQAKDAASAQQKDLALGLNHFEAHCAS